MFHHTFYTGRVLSNADPEGLGRVKVVLNGFSSTPGRIFEGQWLRVMSPAAGQARGIQWIPEEGDEVVLGQLGGPADFFVLGCLFNGVLKPPEPDRTGRNDAKILRTRSGNEIRIEDTAGYESIELRTMNGTCQVRLENSSLLPKVSVRAPVVDLYSPAMAPATPAAPVQLAVMPPASPPPVTPTATSSAPPAPVAPKLPLAGVPAIVAETPVCQIKLDSRSILGPQIRIEAPVIELSTPAPPPPATPAPGPTTTPPVTPPPSALIRLDMTSPTGAEILMMAPRICLLSPTVEVLGALIGPVPTPPSPGQAALAAAAATATAAATLAADAADAALEASAKAAQIGLPGSTSSIASGSAAASPSTSIS